MSQRQLFWLGEIKDQQLSRQDRRVVRLFLEVQETLPHYGEAECANAGVGKNNEFVYLMATSRKGCSLKQSQDILPLANAALLESQTHRTRMSSFLFAFLPFLVYSVGPEPFRNDGGSYGDQSNIPPSFLGVRNELWDDERSKDSRRLDPMARRAQRCVHVAVRLAAYVACRTGTVLLRYWAAGLQERYQ